MIHWMCRKSPFRQKATMTIRKPYILQTHGFYVDEKAKTVSFDLVISFDDPNPTETLRAVKEGVEAQCEGYHVYVQYDQDFSLSE